jgi:hypothetical protein
MAERRRKASSQQVVVELHGSRARAGVELDALENFIEYFRRALRDFDRQRRGEMVGRGGHPDVRDAAATAFRVVKFRTGSGILTLEPATPPTDLDEHGLLDDVEHRATATLRELLDAVSTGDLLSPQVLEALANATRSMGDDGKFAVKPPGRRRPVVIDESRLERLRAPSSTESTTLSVTGRLHLIEVDEPMRRVAVKAPDGVDWSCLYPLELKPVVMGAVEKIVRVGGRGRKITPLSGRMEVERIEVVPEYPQDELFTTVAVPAAELEHRQGISAPQGLAALSDPDWEDDEAAKRFLEATLGETR